MKRKKLILISVSLLAFSMQAQMTLNDCLLYATEHSHSNKLARLEATAAATDKKIGLSALLPTLGLNSSANMSFGRNIDPETNTYDNKKTLYTGLGFELSLPVFDGLVRINNFKSLKVAQLRKEKAIDIEQDRISLEVIKAFYNVSYCRAMVDQIQQQLKRDSIDLAATRRSEGLGLKSGADVAAVEAIVASDLYELANQTNMLKKAWLALRGAMGMELTDDPLDLVEESTFEPSDVATRRLPTLEEAELAVDQQKYNLRSARGAFSPQLWFNTGISTSYYTMGSLAPSFARQFRNNMGEYISFSLTIPLFDGLSTSNRVKRARISLIESRIRLEEFRYQIDRATEEALLDMAAAIEEHHAASRRLEAEQMAYNAVRRKFELGSASAIDLYTFGSNLAKARANLEGKRIQQIIAEITYRYYQGYPLINR